MKISEMFSKLESSKEFKSFKKQNPHAYFCAAFFVFDYEAKEMKKQLDYYVSENEIITFSLDDKILQQEAKMPESEKLKEIKKDEIKIDLDEVLEKVKKEAEKLKFKPSKTIVILQRLKETEELIWNITSLSGFSILRMHVSMKGEFLLNQKSSMMDMMKIQRNEKSSGSSCSGSEKETESHTDSANYVG